MDRSFPSLPTYLYVLEVTSEAICFIKKSTAEIYFEDQADKHHKGDNRFGKIALCQPVDLCWQEDVLGDVHKKAGKTHRLNREQSP